MSYYNRKTFAHENEGLMQELIKNWLSDKPKRSNFGNFKIDGNELVYNTQNTERVSIEKDAIARIKKGDWTLVDKDRLKDAEAALKGENSHPLYLKVSKSLQDVISVRLKNGTVLGNSSILPLVGRTMSYGNETLNRSETLIQRYLAQKVIMIPFSVFEQAKLDIQSFVMLEKGAAETITRKKPNRNFRSYDKPGPKNPEFIGTEDVHFTGASLFQVGNKVYLFDIDRVELKHGIFNPFLSEIPAKVKTIAEAYKVLKPKSVIDAEKRGIKVLRQGEWFFIPAKTPKFQRVNLSQEQMRTLLLDRFSLRGDKAVERELDKLPKPTTLRAGPNRPNTATLGLKVGKETLVSGTVTHSGREHAPLKLKGWYRVVPNTAVGSFQITGDVD